MNAETSTRVQKKGKAIANSDQFGKVAVLMGGLSAEREISLKSGNAVLEALLQQGVDAHGIDAGTDVMEKLQAGGYERAFIVLHGRGGEDGVIQGALETLGLSYTGSGVLGSALSMDKLRSKQLWDGVGIPTPEFVLLDQNSDLGLIEKEMKLPLIVKPVHEGSSLGMSLVSESGTLGEAWRVASEYDKDVIAEKWIDGAEYTAAILGRDVLPLIKLETEREFYDYEAKYVGKQTNYICPCGLDEELESDLQKLAIKAFDAVEASDWGRVDFMLDNNQQPWLIEVNTVPGMTDHSLVPMAAKVAGMDFNELVWRILETSFLKREQGLHLHNDQQKNEKLHTDKRKIIQ